MDAWIKMYKNGKFERQIPAKESQISTIVAEANSRGYTTEVIHEKMRVDLPHRNEQREAHRAIKNEREIKVCTNCGRDYVDYCEHCDG